MKLAKSFEQGVIVLAILTTQDQYIPVSAMAIHRHIAATHHSLTYTKKILRKLVIAGLIRSIPGSHGGYLLAKDAGDIRVSDIVDALEGPIDSYTPYDSFSHIFPHVGDRVDLVVHDIFKQADREWLAVLNRVTVRDIVQRIVNVDYIPTIDWNCHDSGTAFNYTRK